jgi:IS30 family transposase
VLTQGYPILPNSRYYCPEFIERIEKADCQLPELCHTFIYYDKRGAITMHRQLTFLDRIYIEVLDFERERKKKIAKKLRVDVTTIRRELKRGNASKTGWFDCYKADFAEKKARAGLKRRGRKRKIRGELEDYIKERLKDGWSPEQISGKLKRENRPSVSYEAIYQYLERDRDNGGRLYLYLRHGNRRRKKRFYIPRSKVNIELKKSIEERPKIINDRERIGDWERDLMFGDSRKAGLLTFVERKTLYTLLAKVESKSPKEISNTTIQLLRGNNCILKSLTNDNGFEFAAHTFESKELGVPIYFTHPYSSWEKGTNENTNGLIRQYFPKKTPIKELTYEKIISIQTSLNSRPRKKLGFSTPHEAYYSGENEAFKT